jgi:hypothetical protein
MDTHSAIAFVVDPDFGMRLRNLAHRVPVWIVASPTNANAVKVVEAEGGQPFSITPIYANGASAEEWCINHADTVDQHHNEFSQERPYTTLEVFGCEPTPQVRASFAQLGFHSYQASEEGFVASQIAL